MIESYIALALTPSGIFTAQSPASRCWAVFDGYQLFSFLMSGSLAVWSYPSTLIDVGSR
jgi:hypothetical protein